jgi:hypothetical protein
VSQKRRFSFSLRTMILCMWKKKSKRLSSEALLAQVRKARCTIRSKSEGREDGRAGGEECCGESADTSDSRLESCAFTLQ